MAESNKHKISKTEWGLIIGLAVVVDVVQIVLDLIGQVGVVINRFIDVFYGLCWGFYLQMRGQSLANPKRLISMIATFVGEEIPDVDAFPFWTADAIYMYLLYKANEKLEETAPDVQKVIKFSNKISSSKSLNTNEVEN